MADRPVLCAYLFGSHARGQARADSDVDIAVYLSDDVDESRYLPLSVAVLVCSRTAPASGLSPVSSC